MMRKDKVITNYERWSDFELSTLAGRVVAAMGDAHTQSYFPNPDPDLPTLEALSADFIAKHEIASQRGSGLQISEKNESREALIEGLKKLAHYVNGVAAGRTSMLLSTGLVLVSSRQKLQVPGIPERLRLRDGALMGQMRLDFDPVRGAWEYEIDLGETELNHTDIQWLRSYGTSSTRGNILTDLISGLVYHVRVRARNGKGIGDWSAPVSLLCR